MKKGRTVWVAERLGKLLDEKLKPIKPHKDRLGGTQKLMIGFPAKQPLVTESDKGLSCLNEFSNVLNISERLSGVLKACVGEANPSTMTVTPARPSNKHTSTNWLQEHEPMDTHAWHDARVTDAPKTLHSPSFNHSQVNKQEWECYLCLSQWYTFFTFYSRGRIQNHKKSPFRNPMSLQIPGMCSSTVGSADLINPLHKSAVSLTVIWRGLGISD